MSARKLTSAPHLTLQTPPNWTAVVFFAALGAMHASIAIPAFWHGRWEGFLSLAFGIMFTLAGLMCGLISRQITIFADERRIKLSTGIRRLRCERCVSFDAVYAVRLTLLSGRNIADSRIEILCTHEAIECPPTRVPGQEALCLAMLMGVRLIKVYSPDAALLQNRLDHMAHNDMADTSDSR